MNAERMNRARHLGALLGMASMFSGGSFVEGQTPESLMPTLSPNPGGWEKVQAPYKGHKLFVTDIEDPAGLVREATSAEYVSFSEYLDYTQRYERNQIVEIDYEPGKRFITALNLKNATKKLKR